MTSPKSVLIVVIASLTVFPFAIKALDKEVLIEQLSWTIETTNDLRGFADLMSEDLRRIVPPNTTIWQPCQIEPLPVSTAGLAFLSGATWEYEYSVPMTWLGLFEDEDGSVKVLDRGGWGKQLTSLPPPNGYIPWSSRLTWPCNLLLQIKCVDKANVASYLYAKEMIEQYAAEQNAGSSRLEESGVYLLDSVESGDVSIIGIARTNNGLRLDIGYPESFSGTIWSVYSYDALTCLSTNGGDGGGIPEPPSVTNECTNCGSGYCGISITNTFDGLARVWFVATNYLLLTGATQIAWTDDRPLGINATTNPVNRFYGLGNNGIDADGDGASDALETFTVKTDAALWDTDGDGLSDGWEYRFGLNPLLDVTADLRAWYQLEELSGTNIADSGLFSATGQLIGSPTPVSQSGAVGRSLRFDGLDDGITIPHTTALDIQPELTLSAWIWPALNISTSRQAIIQKNVDYYLNTRDGKLQFTWYLLSTNGSYWAATNVLQTGVWSHVAATYNGSNVSMYINGIMVLESNATAAGATTTNNVGIGHGFGQRYWNGAIDDVRVYNRGLESNQIYSLWFAGADPDNDGLRNGAESQYKTDPNNPDTDNDTLSDADEVALYGTDPTISNVLANISGNVTYKGSTTGQVVVLASTSKFVWTSRWTQILSSPGSYTLSNLLSGTSYWVKAFRDLNSNGLWDAKEPPYFRITNVVLTSAGATSINVHVEKMRGMRVDFGEYYGGQWSGVPTKTIAGLIVSNAVDWGVNTLYARGYYERGTYWRNPTTLWLTNENGHGKAGILTDVIARAHANGIKVIAWLQPVNGFMNAWSNNPSWRYVNFTNSDYSVQDNMFYWLSPFKTEAMDWLVQVINEIIDQGVDGVDVSETDYVKFTQEPTLALTYDAAANSNYFQRFPGGTLGDQNWFRLRKEILTSNLFGRLGATIIGRGKEFHTTYIWTANNDGSLKAESVIATNTGFSFDGIMNLPQLSRPDVVVSEFIWQSRAKDNPALYPSYLNPEWTIITATQYLAFANGRVLATVHPEITLKQAGTNLLPSLTEFQTTLIYAVTNAPGCDFFIHHLAFTNNYLRNGTNVDSFGFWAVSHAFHGRE